MSKVRGRKSQGANKPGGESARGRTSQGANRQRGEKARHRDVRACLRGLV